MILQIENYSADELKTFIALTIADQFSKYQQENDKPEPGFITRKTVKDRTGLSYPTIISRTQDGTFKGYRIGGRVLYKWHEIENSLETIVPKI